MKKPISSNKSYRIPTVSKKKNAERSELIKPFKTQTIFGKDNMKI